MNPKEETVHIHYIAQHHNCTIERALEKYGELKDEKGMIPKSALNNKL